MVTSFFVVNLLSAKQTFASADRCKKENLFSHAGRWVHLMPLF